MKHSEFKNRDKHNTGFVIPEGYFEAFENKLMQQITAENSTYKNTLISLFDRKFIWMSSLAAVFVVTIGIVVYYSIAANTSLESSTIEQYLIRHQNVTTTEIVTHLSDDDIRALAASLAVSATECDDIETYLLESEHLEYILND